MFMRFLESNKIYFKNYFKWNLEEITNLRTRSTLKYHTKAPGTKDGGRPGKVDFDEYHAYQDYKLINVVTTGLGKVEHPRKTIITTNGDVRDGPLDVKLNENWMFCTEEDRITENYRLSAGLERMRKNR